MTKIPYCFYDILKSSTLSSLLLLIEVIILLNILNENKHKNAIAIKTAQQTMNAEDEKLPTVADSSAKSAFEINKKDFYKQKQTQLQPIRQMTTLHPKQQELDSGYSDTKSERSESSYNSTYNRKTLRPRTSVPTDLTFKKKQLLQD